jgi:presenilin-like A22 family membrane protease
MDDRAAGLWGRTQLHTRQFTLIDLMVIVAMMALVLSAVAGTLSADLPTERKAWACILATACPTLCALLWFLAGLKVDRPRVLDGLLSIVCVLLTVFVSLLILMLLTIHQAAAAMTCLTLPVLIAYLSTWSR